MQFKADSEAEFVSTINSIISANIYDKNSMIYALDIDDGDINKLPDQYPCIVIVEFEEFEASNMRYAFQACKFIYLRELLNGTTYQNQLKELNALDSRLCELEAERDTSGAGFPMEEIARIQEDIIDIEKQLF